MTCRNDMDLEQKSKSPNIFAIVESVVLAMSVGLLVWVANVVVTHGNMLSAQTTQINVNTSRIDRIETHGSAGLETLQQKVEVKNASTDSRLDKLESAVLVLQATPGELKSLNARMDNFLSGQVRIEKLMEEYNKSIVEHMNKTRP